jgi:tetratricopeptide (TPR) repeat protein
MTEPDSRATQATAPRIWGKVPQRIKNFTGRVDILEKLWQGESQVTAVLSKDRQPHALQGLAGVGKTAVAIEYAHRYRDKYDLIWWIPSDQITLIRPTLAALAVQLRLEGATATGIDGAASLALDALRRGEPYRRWLLIFDNADQPEDFTDFIPPGPGDVLITSRNHRWQGVFETVQVDVFARAESVEFLIKRAPKALAESDADQLADKLGDLPLALEQAGALLAETGMPVSQYLSLLDQHVSQILAEGKPPEYPLSMTAAWRLSVSTLQEQLPQALELLRCCAFFSPDPIPRDVFRGTQAASTQVGELIADPILLARAIRALGRFALVKIDGGMISVHRLIQALLRDNLHETEQSEYRHEVHRILTAGSPGNPGDSTLWPRYRELLAHVTSDTTELAECQQEPVRNFAMDMVRYLYSSGDLKSCLAMAEEFVAQWAKSPSGPDHPTVLNAQRHRGNALLQLGRYTDAYDIIEATLAKSRTVLGEREPLTLALRNSFGAVQRARGDFAAALETDTQTQELHQEFFGKTDPRTLRVMNNVAGDYGLNARYAEARQLHQQVYLQQRDAVGGVSALDILISMNGLAWAIRLSGDFAAARDLGEEAWDYGREKLGADHYATLRTATGLSIALRRMATAPEDALQLAGEVYQLCRQLYGERSPDTMAAAVSLTNIQRAAGQAQQALQLAKDIAARYTHVYGPDHPYCHGCYGNLALLHRVSGDPAEARRLDEAALEALAGRLTLDHDYSLVVAVNLASDCAALGDTGSARRIGEDSLARSRGLLGEDHPLTLGCAANLAMDLRAGGAGAEAGRLLAETMSRYAATIGTDHHDAVNAASGQRLDFDFDPPPV